MRLLRKAQGQDQAQGAQEEVMSGGFWASLFATVALFSLMAAAIHAENVAWSVLFGISGTIAAWYLLDNLIKDLSE
jgi:uncharacterized membrane protein